MTSKNTMKLCVSLLEEKLSRLRYEYDNPVPAFDFVKEKLKKKMMACWVALNELQKELGTEIELPIPGKKEEDK
ncbi:MAG: hypothetical protein WC998_01405 [Candidatus Paceibacterota bacterium]|jgi:hypothetical protein